MTVTTLRWCNPPAGRQRDTAGVVAPPPLIYAAGLSLGLVLGIVLPQLPIPAAAAAAGAGAVGVAGAALAVGFFRALRRAGTAVDPGRPTTALVTSGPYRFTRNPGYLAMTLAYVAAVLATGSLGALLMLVPTLAIVDCGVVRREEHYLAARFGAAYDDYRARVRRWI